MQVLLVVLGGVLGGWLRYLVGLALPGHAFPFATWLVNLAGSFALGALTRMVDEAPLPQWVTAGFGTGVIGAFTTFSTFCLETVALLHTRLLLGFIYGLSSLAGGVVLAYAGYHGTSRLLHSAQSKEMCL